jgi:hypothetical protein
VSCLHEDLHAVAQVTTTALTAASVTVRARRLGADGWGANLQSDFIAADALPAGAEVGAAPVSSRAGATWTTVSVTFASGFGAPPVVFATLELGAPGPSDAVVATAYDVSAAGASFNISQVYNGPSRGPSAAAAVSAARGAAAAAPDDSAGRGLPAGPMTLHWLAWGAPAGGTLPEAVAGSITVPGGGPTRQVTAPLPGYVTAYAPCVLSIARAAAAGGGGGVFATTSFIQNATTVGINVMSMDGQPWGKGALVVDFLVWAPTTRVAAVAPLDGGTLVTGAHVSSLVQAFGDGFTQSARAFAGGTDDVRYVSLEYNVGPLEPGHELVLRAESGLATGPPRGQVWYTDENGLEMSTRVFNGAASEIVAGNYYPSAGTSFIRGGGGQQLTLVADRAHGVTSGAPGALEVMLHRRCLQDDGFGVGEVLDDATVVQPAFRLFLDAPQASAALHRRHKLLQKYPLVPFFGACVLH